MNLTRAFLVSLAAVLNQHSGKNQEFRADSAETMLLARQVEKVLTKVFDVEYPVPEAIQHIPMDDEVPPGAQQFTYRMMDRVGAAKVISNYADNLPRIDALMKEYPAKVTPVGDSFGYSIPDLMSAAFAGIPLESTKARLAREAIDRVTDELLSVGDADIGLEGFLNNSNVPRLTVPNGNWLTGATPDEILRDISAAITQVITQTKNIHKPNTLGLPLDMYTHILHTPRSANSDVTILKFLLDTSPYIKEVFPWYRLDTAGPSSAPMGVLYEKDISNLRAVVPVPFNMLSPEIRNLEWVVNCFGQVGGTVWMRPMSAVYLDGLA